VIRKGHGQTIWFSSAKILFSSENRLALGKTIELLVVWPARLSQSVGLRLFISGLTTGIRGARTEVQIVRYEFRTRMLSDAAGRSNPPNTFVAATDSPAASLLTRIQLDPGGNREIAFT